MSRLRATERSVSPERTRCRFEEEPNWRTENREPGTGTFIAVFHSLFSVPCSPVSAPARGAPLRKWTIPRIPRSANKMLRSHWAQRRKDKESWREHVQRACGQRKRRFTGRVRLSILVYRQRLQDPDNAYASVKNLLDALRNEGWLANDSPGLLSLNVTEQVEPRKLKHRTVLWWEPEPCPRAEPSTPASDRGPGGGTQGGRVEREKLEEEERRHASALSSKESSPGRDG